MTAPSRHAPGGRGAEAVIALLLTQVKAAGTKADPPHLAIKVNTEHLGYCNTRRHYRGDVLTGECGAVCQAWQEAIALAEAYLSENAEPEIRQLEMTA